MPDFQREMFNEENDDRDAWWNIKKDDLVIDCGAGTGSWAIPAPRTWSACEWSFECDPHRVAALKANVKVNPGMEMTIDSRGLYSHECEMNMDMDSSSVVLNLGYTAQQKVKLTTIDNFVETYNIDKLDWLKIDVEGGRASCNKWSIKDNYKV